MYNIITARETELKQEREVATMTYIADIKLAASSLYDGGWRAADRDQLIAEYDLIPADADAICFELEEMEQDAE